MSIVVFAADCASTSVEEEKLPMELMAKPVLVPKIAIHCIVDNVRFINSHVKMAHQMTTLL